MKIILTTALTTFLFATLWRYYQDGQIHNRQPAPGAVPASAPVYDKKFTLRRDFQKTYFAPLQYLQMSIRDFRYHYKRFPKNARELRECQNLNICYQLNFPISNKGKKIKISIGNSWLLLSGKIEDKILRYDCTVSVDWPLDLPIYNANFREIFKGCSDGRNAI